MMYFFWFLEFLFNLLIEPLKVGLKIGEVIIEVTNSLFNFLGYLPAWINIPFTVLISIAVLFRVSQFVPTIGGAS